MIDEGGTSRRTRSQCAPQSWATLLLVLGLTSILACYYDGEEDPPDSTAETGCSCTYRCVGDSQDRVLDASSNSQCEFRADQSCRFDLNVDFDWSNFICE